MSRRGRGRRAPGSQGLPVEAPADTSEAPGTGPANAPAASVPAGTSEAARTPRPQDQTRGQHGASERALIEAALRETRLRRARKRALREHPELAPVLDLIGADSPQQYRELAADLSARLRGGDPASSPSLQPTVPTVGPSNVALEDPLEADLEAAHAAGDFAAVLKLKQLRAATETRRRS
jgi:hypothetical protein